jgi:hypothetical protein
MKYAGCQEHTGGDKMNRVRACAQARGLVHARTCM